MKNQTGRLEYLDWMRGLAALIMLQGHAFDSWLHPSFRDGETFWLSQFFGGFPAPIFLFLVGVSLAIVLDRQREKPASTGSRLQKVLKRGAWILLLAYAFRIEQFWMWYPVSRWSDVFRIDTLNCIAASTLVIGCLSIAFKTRLQNIVVMGFLAAAVVFLTPWIYPLRFAMPDVFMDYFNGNGHAYNFSLFPWVAFTLTGIAFGYAVLEARSRDKEAEFFSWVIACGLLAYAVGLAMRFFPVFEYGYFDYSLTSPHFFLIRLGCLTIFLYGAYRWTQRPATRRWSPLRAFGQASLLVYWVHMELVYGRPLHGYERALDVGDILLQLLWLIPAMLALAAARQYGFGRLFRASFAGLAPVFSRVVPGMEAGCEQQSYNLPPSGEFRLPD